MKKNIIVLFIIIFLMTGCESNETNNIDTINYNLKINDTYNEKIISILPNNAYDIANESVNKNGDVVPLEYALLLEDTSAIYSNDEILYNKKIEKNNNYIKVTLNYNYIEDDFINSKIIKNCFENYYITQESDYIEINLSGNFYCSYDKTVYINIDTNHNVLESNGTLENGVYRWKINSLNKNDVNINYKISRDRSSMSNVYVSSSGTSSSISNILKLLGIGVLITILVLIYKFLKKKYNL